MISLSPTADFEPGSTPSVRSGARLDGDPLGEDQLVSRGEHLLVARRTIDAWDRRIRGVVDDVELSVQAERDIRWKIELAAVGDDLLRTRVDLHPDDAVVPLVGEEGRLAVRRERQSVRVRKMTALRDERLMSGRRVDPQEGATPAGPRLLVGDEELFVLQHCDPERPAVEVLLLGED